MNKARFYLFISLVTLSLIFTGCSFTADLDEIHSSPLPNLENTDGNAGGTGGSNPPPPGE